MRQLVVAVEPEGDRPAGSWDPARVTVEPGEPDFDRKCGEWHRDVHVGGRNVNSRRQAN